MNIIALAIALALIAALIEFIFIKGPMATPWRELVIFGIAILFVFGLLSYFGIWRF